MHRLLMIAVLALVAILPGCAAHGLQSDQDRIRLTLLDLYTNQIMDNLIRAHNNQPIVQLDYTNATAQLTLKETTGLNDSLVTNNPGVLSVIAGSTASVVSNTMNMVTGNLTADRSNQVSITATPVTTSADAYNAYLEFLALPGSFQMTCNSPPSGAAHLCRKRGHEYYWVPIEYQKAFLRLALATTAQRGQPATAADPFYSVNIVDVLKVTPGTTNDKRDFFAIVVKFDKKIPTDLGSIEIGGTAPAKTAFPTPAPGPKDAGQPGAASADGGAAQPSTFLLSIYQPGEKRVTQSDQFIIEFDTTLAKGKIKTPQDLVKALPIPAKVYLRSHRPVASVGNDSLNRLEFQLQQIQFNQTRTNP